MISIVIILYITIINLCIYPFIHSQHISLIDSTTFDVFINENPIVFVNFFAPWCGHCKTIANELQEASTELQNNNEIAKIIFVDASLPINEDLARDEEVNGYPTLTLYKNGQRLQEYLGSRKKNDFLNYIYKKSGPDTLPVSSMDEIVAYCSKIDPRGILGGGITSIVLGLFLPSSPDSSNGLYSNAAKTFIDVATKYDQSIFLLADNINLVNRFEIGDSSMLIFTNQQGNQPDIITLSNALSTSLLTYYIISHSVPSIV
jgi:protein disulfide-isomerase-like protein